MSLVKGESLRPGMAVPLGESPAFRRWEDVNYLHLSLMRRCGLAATHECLAGPTARDTVRRPLTTTRPLTLRHVPDAVTAAVEVPGRATRRVVGGNLVAVSTSVGVKLPDLRVAILFLEDQRSSGLGALDRRLTQLVAGPVVH